MSKNTIKVVSIEGVTSFCFHEDSGCLFDCGEGASLFLRDDLKKIKKVFLSDDSPEHINGIRSLVKVCGNIEIFYPSIYAASFESLEKELINDANVVWQDVKNDGSWIEFLDDNNAYIEPVDSVYNGKPAYAYQMLEYYQKLKPCYSGVDSRELAKIKKRGESLTFTSVRNILFYSVGVVQQEQKIKGSKVWVCGGSSAMTSNKSISYYAKKTIFTHFPFTPYWSIVKPISENHRYVPPILISSRYEE